METEDNPICGEVLRAAVNRHLPHYAQADLELHIEPRDHLGRLIGTSTRKHRMATQSIDLTKISPSILGVQVPKRYGHDPMIIEQSIIRSPNMRALNMDRQGSPWRVDIGDNTHSLFVFCLLACCLKWVRLVSRGVEHPWT